MRKKIKQIDKEETILKYMEHIDLFRSCYYCFCFCCQRSIRFYNDDDDSFVNIVNNTR